jgi:hypothetical protein
VQEWIKIQNYVQAQGRPYCMYFLEECTLYSPANSRKKERPSFIFHPTKLVQDCRQRTGVQAEDYTQVGDRILVEDRILLEDRIHVEDTVWVETFSGQ